MIRSEMMKDGIQVQVTGSNDDVVPELTLLIKQISEHPILKGVLASAIIVSNETTGILTEINNLYLITKE